MKRLLLIAAVILVGVTASAQHLTFMGIPIDGNRAHFIRELMFKKDFKKSEYYSKENPTLTGKFSERDVLVIPLAYGKNRIWRVGVMFDETQSWRILKSTFNTLVDELTTKYGSPSSVRRDTPDPYFDGSGKEMDGLRYGKVDWQAEFITPNGYISVFFSTKIALNGTFKGMVTLSYTDGSNEFKKMTSAMNDL